MFLLRQAALDDVDRLTVLAKHLDTINLPADPDAMQGMIERSLAAFNAAALAA